MTDVFTTVYAKNGNVGIGTNDPNYSLDVHNGGSTVYINSKFDASKNTFIGTSTSYGFLQSVGNHLEIGGDGDYQMELHSDKVMINNPLHITANSYVQAIKFRYYPSYDFDIASIETKQNGSTSYESIMMFKLCNGSNNFEEKMRIMPDGKVGINTSNISRNLHIHGSGENVYLRLTSDNTNSDGLDFGYWGQQDSGGPQAFFINRENSPMVFKTNNSERLRIHNNGNVSIGTTGQYGKFSVYGSHTVANSGDYYNYFTMSNTGANKAPTDGGWDYLTIHRASYAANSIDVSIYASGYFSGDGMYNYSDRRIKQNIVEIDDDLSLKILRDISCCTYEYKDKVKKGEKVVVGFIAQQVREKFPVAVGLAKAVVPTEMRQIQNPQWSQVLINGEEKFKLTVSDLEDSSANTLYRFEMSNDVSGNDEIEKDCYSLESDPKSFIFDQSWNNVYLYGKEVDDFHHLDKMMLFSLNFSATQEIDRIQQKQLIDISGNKVDIELLKTENAQLKQQNQTLQDRLEAIEKRLQDANI